MKRIILSVSLLFILSSCAITPYYPVTTRVVVERVVEVNSYYPYSPNYEYRTRVYNNYPVRYYYYTPYRTYNSGFYYGGCRTYNNNLRFYYGGHNNCRR